ncbi:MAG: hypothetical protein ACHQD9_07745 [Chitinophagales bacterium]
MKNIVVACLVFTFVSAIKCEAQMTEKNLPGEYYLEGVMEVGSGIKLNDDHTFEMFFSYGSLDKSGKGTWALKGNTVVLNGGTRPANDFKMVSSKKTNEKGIAIKVSDPNHDILRYMASTLAGKGFTDTSESDEDGLIHFDRSSADSIGLLHTIFSDRICYFDISKNGDNYFEFTIEPCIMNIYCDNLALAVYDDYLEGKHPLLDPGKNYTYRKSK